MSAPSFATRVYAPERRRVVGFALVAVATIYASVSSCDASALHDAARAGDRAAIGRLVREGVDLEARDDLGATPLLAATVARQIDAAAALVDAGADADRSSEIDAGSIDLADGDASPGDAVLVSPLIVAASNGDAELVRLLIEGGADLEFQIFDGRTPLLLAVGRGHRDVVLLLVEEGADVNASDRVGVTPLRAAVDRGDATLAALLTARGAQMIAVEEEQAYETLDDRIDYQGFLPEIADPFRDGPVGGVSDVRPLGLALDRRNARLYWSEFESGRIRSATLDGTAIEDVIAPEERGDFGADGPVGIAIDASAARLWWASDGGYPRRISSSDLDGEASRDLVVGETVNRPRAIVVAERVPAGGRRSATDGSYVYWSEAISGRIRGADPGGGDVQELVTSGISSVADRPDARAMVPLGLAWDGASRRLYWTDAAGARIESVSVDALPGSRVAVLDDGDGLLMPVGVVVDPSADRIYWTDPAAAAIFSARLDGGDVRQIFGPNDGLLAPHALALDAGAAKLYWTDRVRGTIARADAAGGTVEVLVRPAGVALGATGSAGSRVHTAPVTGSGSREVAAACGRAIVERGSTFAATAVAAAETCLTKIDVLQAVKRSESDAAGAVPVCANALARLAGAERGDGRGYVDLREELRDTIRADCAEATREPESRAAIVEAQAGMASDYERALLSLSCSPAVAVGADPPLARDLPDCVAGAYARIVAAVLLTRYPNATVLLDELEPFLRSDLVTPDRIDAYTRERALSGFSFTRSLLSAAIAEPAATVASAAAESDAPSDSRRRDDHRTSDAAEAGAAGVSGAADGLTASGQQRSYRARRAGSAVAVPVADDGIVRAGRPLRYRDNADGTISDLVTGLMWEKKCDGCEGLHRFRAKYAWVDPGSENTVEGWLAAVNREGGSGFAGHDDWRIPTASELVSIVDYERFNPAVTPAFDGALCGQGCDDLSVAGCSCTAMSYYWSSTPFVDQSARAVGVAFHLGLVSEMVTSRAAHVRAVRGVSPPSLVRAPGRCEATMAAPNLGRPVGDREAR